MSSLQRLSASRLNITNSAISTPDLGLVHLDLKQDHKLSNGVIPVLMQLRLGALELDGTAIDDEGLKRLTHIKSLWMVGLCQTSVTLSGLRVLCDNLPKLRRLYLSPGPGLTQRDIEQLKREMETKNIQILMRNETKAGALI